MISNEIIQVNCAICDEEVDVFVDTDEFTCPDCGSVNVLEFIDEDDEVIDDDFINDGRLIAGRSILMTWCSRHKEATEHAWTGHALKCLVCWPSKRPMSPIYHPRKEERYDTTSAITKK